MQTNIDIITNLQNQLNKTGNIVKNIGKEKVDNTYKNNLFIDNLKKLFSHTAAQQVKYLELESYIGRYFVENIKKAVSISNYNSFLEIAKKVINNPFLS